MKHLSLSGSVAAVVAVVVLFLVATDRVSAAITNQMLGKPWIAQANFTDFAGDNPLNMTDGNPATATYGLYFNGGSSFQPTVSYNLGSPTWVNTLGIQDTDPSRNLPKSLVLDFSNVATFSSLVATGTVSLADTSYQQVWSPNPPPSPC